MQRFIMTSLRRGRFFTKNLEDTIEETITKGIKSLEASDNFAKNLNKMIQQPIPITITPREIEIQKIIQKIGKRGVREFNYDCLKVATVAKLDGQDVEFQDAYNEAKNKHLELLITPGPDGYEWEFVDLVDFMERKLKQHTLRVERLQEKNEKKKERESRVETKEVRFNTRIAQGDLETKHKYIQRFLEAGDRCKITVASRDVEDARNNLLKTVKVIQGLERSIIIADPLRIEKNKVSISLFKKKKVEAKKPKKEKRVEKSTEKVIDLADLEKYVDLDDDVKAESENGDKK